MSALSFLPTDASSAALRAEAQRFPALREPLAELTAMEGVLVTLSDGCLLARAEADEGEYAFFEPMPYRPSADADAALDRLEVYAAREELPLVLTDLDGDACERLSARYPLARRYALDGERFLLYVQTELDTLGEAPTLTGERITLCLPREQYAEDYGRLCRDSERMRLFGYDDLADVPDATDAQLVSRRTDEWERRAALPFLIVNTATDALLGELVLFAFNGRGAAELSVRLLPEAEGHGYASEAIVRARDWARDSLGLARLVAACHPDNLPCRRMLTRLFGEGERRDGRLCFYAVSDR